jgi:hypothetical protein
MDPQAPNVPPVQPEAPVLPKIPQVKKSSPITIISVAIFIILALGAIIFLYYQNQQLKNMLANYQSQPTASPTPTATANPTANWKTYSDQKYGFSVKYPSMWETANPTDMKNIYNEYKIKNYEIVLVDKSNPLIMNTTYPALQIAVPFKNDAQLSLSSWVLKYLEYNKIGYPSVSKIDPTLDFTELTIDHYEAIKYGDSVFISKDGGVYFIGFIFIGKSTYDRDAVFDQILSTFKFIGATPTPPELTAPGTGCLYQGKNYNNGSAVPSGDKCNTCSCENGQVACTTMACQ